jgi:hypothetical protein
MESGAFFYAGLDGGYYQYDPEAVVLDCYRLAKAYSRDPEEFLNKPLSAIRRHLYWTLKLNDLQNPPNDDEP